MIGRVEVGVVGLGAMGAAIARRLLAEGERPVVADVRADAVDALVADGAVAAPSPAAVARAARVVLTVLPEPAAVEAVYLGADGVVAGAVGEDMVAVDLSTGDPAAAPALQLRMDGAFLDAGMLANPAAISNGAATLLVGGDAAVLERVEPVLASFAKTVCHFGGAGRGHAAKLVANELFLAQVAAMGEALAVLEAVGLDGAAFLDALAQTGGRGVGLADIGHAMRADPPSPGFALRLAAKDAALLVELAGRAGRPAPLAGALASLYAGAARTAPDLDFTAVSRHQARLEVTAS